MNSASKIAHLPKSLREQLNLRLEDEEPAKALVEWLNSLPEVTAILAADFQGRPISEQNLSAWKHGGFREWQLRRDLNYGFQECASDSAAYAGRIGAQDFLNILNAHFAANLHRWDGNLDSEPLKKLRTLKQLYAIVFKLLQHEQKAERRAFGQGLLESFPRETPVSHPETAPAIPNNPPSQPHPATSSLPPPPMKSNPHSHSAAKPFRAKPLDAEAVIGSALAAMDGNPIQIPGSWDLSAEETKLAEALIAGIAH